MSRAFTSALQHHSPTKLENFARSFFKPHFPPRTGSTHLKPSLISSYTANQWRCPSFNSDSSSNESSSPNASTEDAFSVAQETMNLFKSGNTSAIISYLPDDVIDNALERKRSKLEGSGGLHQVDEADLTLIELLELSKPADFTIDAYAMRGLVFNPPKEVTALSTLRITPELCRQRFSVTAFSGEEMAMVFDLTLEDAFVPKYRGFKVAKKFFLKSITGEPAEVGELPSTPEIRFGPEAVILAQLAGLKSEDARWVFEFASNKNKMAFNNSLENFSEMLGSESFCSLLGHTSAEILRSQQLSAEKNFAVVGVTRIVGDSERENSEERCLFGWAVGLQDDGTWRTEAVYPLGYNVGFHAI